MTNEKQFPNWVSSLKKAFSKNEKKSLKTTKDKAITIKTNLNKYLMFSRVSE